MTQPRPRLTDALFQYAYMGRVRTADERRQGTGNPDYIDKLAALAEDEDWDGLDAGFMGDKRILKSYVWLTFQHVQEDGQVRESPDGSRSVFNTGLATRRQETIYGVFIRNSAGGPQAWRFDNWYEESHRTVLNNFPDLPDFATYAKEPGDYIYDWTRRLIVNSRHVVEDHTERFPSELRGNPHGAELQLEAAVKRAEKRVRRTYKAAVPFWYVKQKQVQLLLPLSLSDQSRVDLALVVSREGEYYRGHTVLTPAMAYSNARLLTRPDSDWLHPVSTAEDAPDGA